MSDKSEKGMLGRCGRLYRFALPHWKLVVAATLAMMLYTATNGAFLLLVRPVVKAVQGTEDFVEAGGASDRSGSATAPAAREREPRTIADSKWVRYLPPAGRRVLARATTPGPRQLAYIAVIIGLVLAPIMGIAAFLEINLRDRVQWLVIADLRERIFARLVMMPVRFFDRQRIGELISRMTNDINRSQVALQFLFGELILSPMKIAVSLAVAIYSSWQLSILCLVGMPLVALIVKHFGRRVYRHTRKSLKQLADLTDAMNQMFSGIYVVKAFQMEEAEVSEFKRSNAEQLRQMCRLVKNRALASGIPEAMYVIGTAVFFIVGNRLMLTGELDVGRLATFAAAMVFMSQPLRTLSKGYSRLQEALAASDRLFELYELPTVAPDAPDAVDLDEVREGVTFRQLTFSYEPGQPVLRDVSFFAPAGSVIAVVGETGSGKSTLLNLIPRFHEPDSGAVEIDGIDVRRLKRDALLSKVAIVSQHPFLFNRSIGENIQYGRPGATQEEIEKAARLAGIDQHVSSLPEGYATPAGERGGFLSGGQRQCVTIARAILKDAPLLILDEATSSLDSASEELVQAAFKNLMRGRTTFVIAHRLSTVRNADMIVVLRRGRVVEVGSHEELLAAQGEYHRLYTIQFQNRSQDA